MPPQLDSIARQLSAASRRAQAVFSGLTRAQLITRPPDGGWSIAECVAHLIRTNVVYFEIFERELPRAPQGNGPFRMGLKARLLRWILEPPYRHGVKTSPLFEPVVTDPEVTLGGFVASNEKMIGYCRQADGRAIDRVWIPSPFKATMTYNLYSAFELIAAHQRRHLWQAEQVRAGLDR
jgi:hypothetical protein